MSSFSPPRPFIAKDERQECWDGSPESKVNTYGAGYPLDFSGASPSTASMAAQVTRSSEYKGPRARPLSAAALEYERAYQESRVHGNANRASAPVGSSSWSAHNAESFAPQRTSVPQRKPGDPFGPIEAMASLVRSPNHEGQPLAPARSAQEFFTPSQVEMISGVRTSTRYEWEDAMRGGATFSDSRGGATYSGYERDGGRYPVLPEGAIDHDPGYTRYRSPVTYASTTHVHRQAMSRHRNNGSIMPKVDLGIDRFLNSTQSFLVHKPEPPQPIFAKQRKPRTSIASGDGKAWLSTKPLVDTNGYLNSIKGMEKRDRGSSYHATSTTVDSAMYAAPGFVGIVAMADAMVMGKEGQWAQSLTDTFKPPDFSSSRSSEVGVRSAPDRSGVELHV